MKTIQIDPSQMIVEATGKKLSRVKCEVLSAIGRTDQEEHMTFVSM
jgi:hypothetical protein